MGGLQSIIQHEDFHISCFKKTITHGHVAVRADSLEKAQAVELTQKQLDKSFRSSFSNEFSYEKLPYSEQYQKIYGD